MIPTVVLLFLSAYSLHYSSNIKHSRLSFILFIKFLKAIIKKMQPYEPFYYPYSVAQPLIGPVTLPLRESISRLQK